MTVEIFQKHLNLAIDDLKKDFGITPPEYPSVFIEEFGDKDKNSVMGMFHPSGNKVGINTLLEEKDFSRTAYHEGAHFLHGQLHKGLPRTDLQDEFVAYYAGCIPEKLDWTKIEAGQAIKAMLSAQYLFGLTKENTPETAIYMAEAAYTLCGRERLKDFASAKNMAIIVDSLLGLPEVKRKPKRNEKGRIIRIPIGPILEKYRVA